ncbi:pilus assembly protein TadG-related protein [Qipengyuania spongiae]|uniref:Pilus assembly protein TadG-related protein n=1 Tax=Qipengyuania spongiae TaxID=2909673 RepID=A0ABY5SUT5_9SPHN|nr:pilus assembly protein TadG-related protein [Qipengyuania spongiae]
MMAIGLLTSLAATGSAIDIGRIYMVKLQLQAGVDAAALAGARSFSNTSSSDAGRDKQVDSYFAENFPDGYLGTTSVRPDRSFRVVDQTNVTTVSARASVPMAFMQIFGFSNTNLNATATAELQPRPLEVMVVLDDTGSMQTKDVGGGSRMDALKAAMHTFVDTLHAGRTSREDLALGFVTYNVTTNVGDILTEHGVAIEPMDGFTNIGTYTNGINGRGNPLGWMGCVEDDATVQNLSSSPSTFEAGAWDIVSSLPGEETTRGRHPAVRPYHYKPLSLLNNSGDTYSSSADSVSKYVPKHTQSNTSDGRRNNHYLLSPGGDMSKGQELANKAAYRQHFYDFYIGLNNGSATASDDVIVSSGDGYFDPASGGAWKVKYDRIPYIGNSSYWAQPNPAYGYPLNSPRRINHTLKMATPNWQCPEPAMKISYGRQKSEYLNYVDYDNYAVMPASGTLHHIGLLWGYRLLARDDVFRRTNPYPDQKPIKALVFMTDGETSLSSEPTWYGAYGRLADRRLTDSTSTGNFQTQIMRRFAKVCEAAKRDDIDVYIVSLKANVGEFSTCAGDRYYRTSDAATINDAFGQIAVDLVDLHLTD